MKNFATILATGTLALLSSTDAAESIVGSKPYVVSMRSGEFEGTIAAGLLITPKHVLTLAQFPEYIFHALVGEANEEGPATTGEVLRVVKKTAHPNSSRSNVSTYNFFIAELERPSKFTPVALADRDVSAYTIRDDSVCRAGNFPKRTFNPSLFCAGGTENDAKCRWDWGGPIVVEREGKPDLALGSVIVGDGCGLAGQPGLYTRAYLVKSWIEENAPGVKFE